MSYIDGVYDKNGDRIVIVERLQDGERKYVEYPVNYTFYYDDPKGKHRSIYGEPVTRISTRKRSEFEKERRINSHKKLYESDINPVFRCLSENYLGKDVPKLHTCFFDIESDFDNERGFAPTEDPFNKVTAVTVYLDWLDQLVTLSIPPKTLSKEEAENLCSDFENVFLFDNEIDMFNVFFELIDDSDILTGWNSEGYDIPYLVNRVTRVMSKDDTRNFCLMNQFPKERKYERFGKEETTYDLVGRVHMDYLQLYKKFNYESRHSYKLDFIGEMEVGENKTPYEGTLDQLYNKDFKKFIEYNRQDVMLMVKIHRKLKFLELANQLAHENTVLLPTVMGSVAMIEQAVINEAHSRNMVVPDKVRKGENDEESKAAGAYVATPKGGIQYWVGACDINSLYPSIIRSLNFAPETIVGQIRQTLTEQYLEMRAKEYNSSRKRRKETEDDELSGSILWENMFGSLEYLAVHEKDPSIMLTIDFENGQSTEMSAAEIWELIYNSYKPWMLSANGTIFTYEVEGVIPGLLSKWYSERKEIQKKLKASTTKEDIEYYDKRQLVRKILLNSAYGALLNEHCRFYDKRIGQSVTLSGRQIVRHMMSHINEQITGEYKHDGDGIIYGDTDSCMFSVYPVLKNQIDSKEIEWNKEVCIKVYDEIAEKTNSSFPDFMYKAFHAPTEKGSIIKAGRELVGDRCLFIRKKKYAINVYDKEGKRLDVDGKMGKMKIMGLEIKRSDTPKEIQDFLYKLLEMVLQYGKTKEDIVEYIMKFKKDLSLKPSWEKGSPRAVNKLTYYEGLLNKNLDAAMPGHVRASLNWNYLRRVYNDNYTMKIVDGMKVVVCKLRTNPLGYTSVAYPVDEIRLPSWFTSMPFDDVEMERVLVDEKVENLFGILQWNLREDTDVKSNIHELFTFE